MKLTKILLSISSAAAFAFTFSSCSSAVNSNQTINININKSNSAVVNSNQTTVNNAVSNANTKPSPAAGKASTTPAPSDDAETVKLDGQLHLGKTSSYIFYVGKETGDFAAYCFSNDSEAGRAILAACKDGDQCEFSGEVAEDEGCAVPDLEADLSGRGRIVKVQSVKKLSGKK